MTFHIEPLTWYEAAQRCKQDYPYSHLVSVTSMDKQNYIIKKIESRPDLTQTSAFGYWTGGNDEASEGRWMWTGNGNPVPLNYTDWHVGQPNNVGGDQDCLLIQYYDDHFKWGDVSCTETHPFICEANYSQSRQSR
ncbi:hypothetical protein KUTeg_024599 [Tegillarca granosa]|uniref:C-type lectin domain-containing protein n=1 Tax=Tegillarca granosa TaxID=220873 RepID=A0ABQ9DXU8_TEGGR|nr:hypothetical protein KUTeg_024599 [Tegillarca granosa]